MGLRARGSVQHLTTTLLDRLRQLPDIFVKKRDLDHVSYTLAKRILEVLLSSDVRTHPRGRRLRLGYTYPKRRSHGTRLAAYPYSMRF